MRRPAGITRLAVITALMVSACSNSVAASAGSGAPATAVAGSLTIYAASSLTAAFRDLATAYRTSTGTSITLSFDASSTLETQIEQGAPADILASADAINPARLAAVGLADGAPITFARNALTIIVPASGTHSVTRPQDLANAGVRVIAAGDAVPITKYATQLIGNLARQPGYPADFARSVTRNIASREDNVKGIVAKVELGEGDAGIVYVTDARATTRIRIVDVPPAANVPATYAAIAVRASRNPVAARAFLTWLQGAEAQATLARYGFLPPG